jgi:hypothetical protein
VRRGIGLVIVQAMRRDRADDVVPQWMMTSGTERTVRAIGPGVREQPFAKVVDDWVQINLPEVSHRTVRPAT